MNAAVVACQRRDCGGSYEDVGGGELYCDVCGMAPVVSPQGMVASPPTGITGQAGPGGSSSSRSEGSSARSGGSSARSAGSSARSGRSSATGRDSSSGTSGRSRSARSSSSRRSVSGRLSRSMSGRTSSRSVSVRSSRSSTSASSGRNALGAGLVNVPDVPRPDPRTAVLADPEVPERKRFCSRGDCGAPVGRARGVRPGRTEGFCTKCGHPYSFVPKLNPGDIVHGQYEVAGCLAHGGLGWIYLAIDRAVSDRWVVLKGLLDTGDEEALAAAVSERRFLAEIEHSNIVRIYNFVEHLDQRTGSLDGYIVMEYVGGKSLKDIANARRTTDGRRDPLPVEQACAYGIEALEALGHLHSRNLLYCDFKVDNAIQQQDQLKLIDMGAVRRMDDHDSPIYGTVGYQAPEISESGPSISSDLYTVARTLAVLTFDFQGYTNVFVDSLPDPEHIEVFRRYESFYRLLVRATDPDPGRRFASAREMADQLTGVLREVVALQTGRPRPALSTLFGPEPRVVDTELFADDGKDPSLLGARSIGGATTEPLIPAQRPPGPLALPVPAIATLDGRATALALPVPLVDSEDPNAGFLAGLLAADPAEVSAALRTAPVDSVELRLRRVRAQLELAQEQDAGVALTGLEAAYSDDWRIVWYRGLHALATGDRETAALSFDAVYDAFPGEPAPKLALGVCAEVLGQLDNAAEYYRLVWAADPSFVSAAFGLARVLLCSGDRPSAVRALESVPESSIHYTAARVAAVRARLRQRAPYDALLTDLTASAVQVERLGEFGLDAVRRERLRTEVLGSALDWVLSGSSGAPPGHNRPPLLGSSLDERGLRFGLERSYRVLARLAQRGEERIELVERANRFRPRTWV
ncbi:serine/threonine-protein kinase [Streptomyces rugosispiralis]|uniref:non-specific serine/threonine protein kinase n=1 Tax=Streptomyces rugosispiralis TaxID=2967341 RepID=A0ABT1UZ48_9ACTN|nr:serine/threonine-protein kinase [Streptomyces rugosispiralis]MCQ8189810.1 serine/threonine-protein kinase PknG [Streptomyces rugosispiralis]